MRYYYDLHVHSCLSPCGDDDNTPNNIAGMATLCGLNVVALTDHNTAKNCPAFFAAAKKYGIIPIAGMELTTSEDIHVVCLFEELTDALAFDEYVNSNRRLIKNRKEIFGSQLILDENDEPIGEVEHLLPSATNIAITDAVECVKRFNGVCYPAHVDREANGVVAILGTLPKDSGFSYFELRDKESVDDFSKKYGIDKERFIISSDAHFLTSMRDKENYFDIDDEPYSSALVRRRIFEILKR